MHSGHEQYWSPCTVYYNTVTVARLANQYALDVRKQRQHQVKPFRANALFSSGVGEGERGVVFFLGSTFFLARKATGICGSRE